MVLLVLLANCIVSSEEMSTTTKTTNAEEDNLWVISGSINSVNNQQRRTEEQAQYYDDNKMLGDDPFSNEIFRSAAEFRPLTVYRTAEEKVPAPDPRISNEIQEYDKPGKMFIQIYNPKQCLNMAVNREDGRVLTTKSGDVSLKNSTLFQLSYHEGAAFIENIQSCLFLCISKDGDLYTSSRPHMDTHCLFRTVFTDKKRTIADKNGIIGNSYSNDTHNFALSADLPAPHLPKGHFVRKGEERLEQAFTFVSIKYKELQSVFSAETISKIYSYPTRHMHYCPGVERRRKAVKNRREYRVQTQQQEQNSKPPSTSRKKSQKRNCSAISERKTRQSCRKAKVRKCLNGRKRKGLSAIERPCTSAERRRRNQRLWPWQKQSQCSRLRSKSDRRLCKRMKRRKCRRSLMSLSPNLEPKIVSQRCQEKQWLEDCVDKKKRHSLKSNRIVNLDQISETCKVSWEKRQERRKRKNSS